VPQRWHQFLIYIGYNIVAFCVNAFANSLLPLVTKGACKSSRSYLHTWLMMRSHVVHCRFCHHFNHRSRLRLTELLERRVSPIETCWINDCLTAGIALSIGPSLMKPVVSGVPHLVENPQLTQERAGWDCMAPRCSSEPLALLEALANSPFSFSRPAWDSQASYAPSIIRSWDHSLPFLHQSHWPTYQDAVAHMIEEIPNPSVEGPKIMIACVAIGVFTGFIFLTVLLFVAGNPQDVISSTAGPLLQIFLNATNSYAGSICLLLFPLICLLFATITIMTTSSRMTYAFARDGGLPASRFFARVHGKLELPLNALYLTTACVVIFGCIFLGSSSAFNAIISASVVALGVSYAIPPAVNCLRGRKCLPPRAFVLPGLLGWFCNLVSLAFLPARHDGMVKNPGLI